MCSVHDSILRQFNLFLLYWRSKKYFVENVFLLKGLSENGFKRKSLIFYVKMIYVNRSIIFLNLFLSMACLFFRPFISGLDTYC